MTTASFTGGGNGQWVRARNKQGAESFIAEKNMESERHQESRAREREFIASVFGWLRSRFHR